MESDFDPLKDFLFDANHDLLLGLLPKILKQIAYREVPLEFCDKFRKRVSTCCRQFRVQGEALYTVPTGSTWLTKTTAMQTLAIGCVFPHCLTNLVPASQPLKVSRLRELSVLVGEHLLMIHTTFDGSPSKEKIGRFKHQTLKHAKRILRLFDDLFARVKKFHNMQKHLHEDMLRHGSSAHGLTLSFESKHQQSKRHTDQHSKKHAEVAAVGHERVVQSLRLNEGVKTPTFHRRG